MTKDKLKTGMVVECRNGYRYVFFDNDFIRECGHESFSNYTKDLNNTNDKDWDIVRIFEVHNPIHLEDIFKDENLKLIWERDNNKKDKLKQLLKEILKEL